MRVAAYVGPDHRIPGIDRDIERREVVVPGLHRPTVADGFASLSPPHQPTSSETIPTARCSRSRRKLSLGAVVSDARIGMRVNHSAVEALEM